MGSDKRWYGKWDKVSAVSNFMVCEFGPSKAAEKLLKKSLDACSGDRHGELGRENHEVWCLHHICACGYG